MNKQVRLNKALSMIGICSRRNAEKLIATGQVSVNGQKVPELGSRICVGDTIQICDKQYVFNIRKQTKIWLYYKPVGIITSHRDDRGRRTVFDEVKSKINERVISVGRLDINSEGLLLLTNDSDFAHRAESPQTGWKRHYKVRAFGEISDEKLSTMRQGVTIRGIRYAPMEIEMLKASSGRNHWFKCVLSDGKNREIRKIFDHFGLRVNRLIRTQYGDFSITNDMKPGDVVMVKVPDH